MLYATIVLCEPLGTTNGIIAGSPDDPAEAGLLDGERERQRQRQRHTHRDRERNEATTRRRPGRFCV